MTPHHVRSLALAVALVAPLPGSRPVTAQTGGSPPCLVATYCSAKTNSLGVQASIGFGGSVTVGQPFRVTLEDAVPSTTALAIQGASGAASLPFMNGLLCVQPPVTRFPPTTTSPSGTASVGFVVPPSMWAAQRWYQWWYRDPQHPDGTGVALSDGLRTLFCH